MDKHKDAIKAAIEANELKPLMDKAGAMDKLKACPCGKIPKELSITDAGQGSKWAYVMGDCCGDWEIEFRTEYSALDSDECMALAIEGWNAAQRTYPEDVVELAKKIKMRGDCKLEFDPKLMTAGIKLASLILQGESK